MEFKGKAITLKPHPLFVRDEAKLAKQFRRLSETTDEEVRIDAIIEAAHILTGIDLGDLNAGSFEEVRGVFGYALDQRNALRAAQVAKEGIAEGDGGGKAGTEAAEETA